MGYWPVKGVGPVQTVNTPASRTRGQIRPSQRGQTKLSQPAAEGARLIGATRTPTPELAEVARVVVPVDLTDPDAASVVTEAALDLGAGIDGVVNCVGAGDFGPQTLAGFLEIPNEQWTDMLERNL